MNGREDAALPPLEILEHVRGLNVQRDFDLATLAMWSEVTDQGVKVERVKCFGFSTEYLSPVDQLAYRRGTGRFGGVKAPRCPFFNYYRDIETGERVTLVEDVRAVYLEDFEKE